MAGLTSLFDPDSATWFGTAYARGDVQGAHAYAYNGLEGVVAAVDQAVREGCPVVGCWRPTSRTDIEDTGQAFAAMTRASGWIPQIAIVLERLQGTDAYGPALSDVVISNDPEIADVLVTAEPDAVRTARQVVDLLGRQGTFNPVPNGGPSLFDAGPLHLGASHALRTSLGRLGGRTVGVAEQSGPLDATAVEKGARFVRMCDAFGIPLIAVAGAQDTGGEVRDGAKLLHAFAESVVPRITLVTGTANVTMNARSLGATRVFAWPGARHDGVDAVVEPHDTRRVLVDAFAQAPVRRGHHRNIPL
ncbi:carboxyl transferase domain-containing protein [Lentzea sp. BCCO 10_0856]|uniref:Carboxyl transferase domain-containing protein n=1 Tax=Lentzea miocenica TaxID=3095431 RepID=A0ABU4SZ26_9PSEU|nr:carboxyl transferase domain-containing protein [Lentzea sp. BCCO 10_0856]MDX8031172.1 carboxyl transferase domain-containing protein [Lentzea sp. BCCO 10_0856]